MNMWRAVAGEGARLKREQLELEIGRLKDPTERANLSHTFSKLFMFLADDLQNALRDRPSPKRSRGSEGHPTTEELDALQFGRTLHKRP